MKNEITVVMDSKSQNEALSRVIASAFVAPLDPTISVLTDIKTAVSEAVTNAVIHGYEDGEGKITMTCRLDGKELYISVKDEGNGIPNIEEAMTPLFTSKPELERSGMGFTVMESFMDDVRVESVPGQGTTVTMTKKIK